MKNFKKEYALIILLVLTAISLLFSRDKITGFFISPTNVTGMTVFKQVYDTYYKVFVDSYTPTWNERDCYSLFELDEDGFDEESVDQVSQIHNKIRVLERNTSREYKTISFFELNYFYDKFSVCSFNHLFIPNNFTPVLFEQTRTGIQQEIDQEIDYKKIADFNCNNGNISFVMWEQPNGTLTMLKSYVIFRNEEVSCNSTAGELSCINPNKTSLKQIVKATLLVNGDKFAYFNYTIDPYLEDYCNPNLPTKITFTG